MKSIIWKVIFMFLGYLQIVTTLDHAFRRKRASFDSSPAVIGDRKCSSGCWNLLRVTTEADEIFRQHFMELGGLGSVVPQAFILNVELAVFQRYCQTVYTPVRECLAACSDDFSADLMRNYTMLETMCMDYYHEMNRYMPCMKFAYEQTTPICESRCVPDGVLQNDTVTVTAASTTNDASNSSDTTDNGIVANSNEQSIYLKPNETMTLFCILLNCISLCEIPMIERHCGRDAAILEAVLLDSMARTEKISLQNEDIDLWPAACDNLILSRSGQSRHKLGISLLLLILFLFIVRS